MVRVILPDDLGDLTEKQFQAIVVEVAGHYGYGTVYHTHFSLGSKSGFPDLALFNPMEGGAIFLEVKVKKNRPTAAQKLWLYDLRCAGFHAYMAHPDHIQAVIDVFEHRYPLPRVGTGEVHPDLNFIAQRPGGMGVAP